MTLAARSPIGLSLFRVICCGSLLRVFIRLAQQRRFEAGMLQRTCTVNPATSSQDDPLQAAFASLPGACATS
jgi:hypothetical protein